jgi:2-iminobutanoate/2-iminopropanoate deaminase
MNKEIIFTEKANPPIGPYSQAVLANGFLFVSGQAVIDRSGIETLEDETRAVFHSLQVILEAAGLSFSHVVKCSVFLKDMNDFPKMNAIYATYFQENFPARETVEVARLPKDARVEISCIAVVQ